MQEDRSVLVLGVGPEEGLGVALCKAFAAEGYSVFGCGRSEENMDALNASFVKCMLLSFETYK